MRKKQQTNVTMLPIVRQMADELMEARGYGTLSELAADLIRSAHEERFGPVNYSAQPSQLKDAHRPGLKYPRKSRKD